MNAWPRQSSTSLHYIEMLLTPTQSTPVNEQLTQRHCRPLCGNTQVWYRVLLREHLHRDSALESVYTVIERWNQSTVAYTVIERWNQLATEITATTYFPVLIDVCATHHCPVSLQCSPLFRVDYLFSVTCKVVLTVKFKSCYLMPHNNASPRH